MRKQENGKMDDGNPWKIRNGASLRVRSNLFSRTKLVVRAHFTLSPHLSPRRGHPLYAKPPLFTCVLSGFGCCEASPTSVGFMARVASTLLDATLAKNLPHRSRENEFTDGRVKKC